MSDVSILRLSFLYLAVVISASETTGQIITATLGQEATLPCQAMDYRPFEVVEWSRSGKHTEYVLVFDQKASDLEIPEQNYKGRVSLVDMEKGDVSLKLENVRPEDGGIYECYVVRGANRKKRAIHPISIVNLVGAPPPPPGNQDGNRGDGGNQDGGNTDGLGVGRSHAVLFVAAFAAVSVVVSMVITVIRRKRTKTSSPPDDAEEPQLI